MKQLLLLILLLPTWVFAQIDPKYDVGKVPVIDGKVTFTRDLKLPKHSQEQLFNTMHKWAEATFVPAEGFQSRIMLANKEKGQIACLGQQYLVFSSRALALDRGIINYQMYIDCEPEKCQLRISAIYYTYNVTGEKMEKIPAEEQIVDELTFNKKRDKILRTTGKFRIKTIDLVEELFANAERALGIQSPIFTQEAALQTTTSTAVSHTTTTTPTETAVPVQTATPTTLPGYKEISPDKIPGNIYKMLSENWMLICGGNQEKFNMMTASWGGLGHLYNKPVSFCFINPTRYTFHLMENNDTYTLCFFTEAYRELLNYCGTHSGKEVNKVKESGLTPIFTPSKSVAFSEAWMIIECKKLVGQQFSKETVFDSEALEKWGENLHKMYIGEIIHVWVK